MKFLMRGLLITAALAFLSSCGAGGAKFSGLEKPKESMAQVYIYRPSAFVQSGNFPDVALDGNEIGQLKNGGFLHFNAPAGKHTINLSGNVMQWIHKDANIPVTLKAGETNFYKLTVSMGGSGGGVNIGFGQVHSFGFVQIKDENVVLEDLKKLKESI